MMKKTLVTAFVLSVSILGSGMVDIKQVDEKSIIHNAVNAKNGRKAAEIINSLKGDAFENAVEEVLDKYYDDNGNVSVNIDDFSSALDSRADSILKDYSEAAEERRNAENLNYDTEEILVTFDSSVSDEKIEELVGSISDGCEIINNMYGINEDLPQYKKERIKRAYKKERSKIVAVDISKGQSTQKAIDEFSSLDGVESVGRNEKYETCSIVTTNDTYLGEQWYLDRINTSDAWEALDKASLCGEIWVAVIDSGVDVYHEDLKGKILKKYSVDVLGETPVNLFEADEPYATDHGTEVSGILMAQAGNGKGIAGVTGLTPQNTGYDCKLMPIKAAFTYGEWEKVKNEAHSFAKDQIKAVKYAVDNGAEIINISIGGPAGNTNEADRKAYQSILNFAWDAEVTVIAAAGNAHTDELYYPVDYSHIISVIALNKDNKRAYYSNYGKNKDISAPGDSDFTCKAENIYDIPLIDGTSYAAPMVSATAAMMLGMNYNLTPKEIDSILKLTATDLGKPGRDDDTGYGLLNAGLAVQEAIYRSYCTTKPVIYGISSNAPNSIRLKWKSVYNEESALIYRSESKDTGYKRVGKVDGLFGDTAAYTDSNLVSGKKYYYKIRFRSTYGSGYKYGIYSDVVSCTAS
ncbi:MAG: S8 family serine peptidase [Lachnospiraceae bacterium]|nr:S8 family serine peptidase [Lachnospiraceae bacterium]